MTKQLDAIAWQRTTATGHRLVVQVPGDAQFASEAEAVLCMTEVAQLLELLAGEIRETTIRIAKGVA